MPLKLLELDFSDEQHDTIDELTGKMMRAWADGDAIQKHEIEMLPTAVCVCLFTLIGRLNKLSERETVDFCVKQMKRYAQVRFS
jgi:hypothetical protein